MSTTVPPPPTTPMPALSPAQRLEASRTRIRSALEAARGHSPGPRGEDGVDGDGSFFDTLLRSGQRIWTAHPLRRAVRVARKVVGPVLISELTPLVRAHPWRLVALAAGLGAAIVWLRPWRLLPQAALGSALLSVVLPRRALWHELLSSGLIDRLASGELFSQWFGASGPGDDHAAATIRPAADAPAPTAGGAGVLHSAKPHTDAARAA